MKHLVLMGLLFSFISCDKERVPLSHQVFDNLLATHVDLDGNVDYSGLKNKEESLKEYLEILKQNAPDGAWSSNKEMAYWINMYNAFTIYNILLEYPVQSIMDIDNGMIWSRRKINVGGTEYTLDQIEQERLLDKFNEPRVHFAVNCAAESCPPLLNKAWTEANIQDSYDRQANLFINNTAYNTISTDSIEISKIFEWYVDDFGGTGQLINYCQQYSTVTISNNAVVEFKTYDWGLNTQ